MTSEPNGLKEKNLKALLGEDALKKYTDFDSPKINQASTFIAELAGDLYSTETPLTPSQGTQLRQAIAEHTEIVKEPMANDGKKQMYRLIPQTDWQAVNASTAAFLTDAQRTVLQNRAELESINKKISKALSAKKADGSN